MSSHGRGWCFLAARRDDRMNCGEISRHMSSAPRAVQPRREGGDGIIDDGMMNEFARGKIGWGG